MVAFVIALTLAMLIFVGGLFILAAILDDWSSIRKFFETGQEVKREKIRLAHKLELEKIRLAHEKESETWRILESRQENRFKDLGLLDEEEDQVKNKAQ